MYCKYIYVLQTTNCKLQYVLQTTNDMYMNDMNVLQIFSSLYIYS